MESYLEPYPVTDPSGTRFEHAVSENELHELGHPKGEVVENLRSLLCDNYANACLIVNDLEKFRTLKMPREIDYLFDALEFEANQLEISCNGHRSSYCCKDANTVVCALTIARTMAYCRSISFA